MNVLEQYKNIYRNGLFEKDYERIAKYLETDTLKRQKGHGVYCGMDYVGIEMLRPLEFVSRFDHSENVCNGSMFFTNIPGNGSHVRDSLIIFLAGLFHDAGTLSFAHAHSAKKGDFFKQESDELNLREVLMQDKLLLKYLKEDKIDIEEICDYTKYPLLDKEIPSLCMDRIDGILATCLFWTKTHRIDEIQDLFNMIGYAGHYNGGELVLFEENSKFYYEDFFEACGRYSKILQSKESRYAMILLGDILKFMELKGILTTEIAFNCSEKEIIDMFLNSPYRQLWIDFQNLTRVEYERDPDNNEIDYLVRTAPKVRYVNPAIHDGYGNVVDYFDISGVFYEEVMQIQKAIDDGNGHLKGNISDEGSKLLLSMKNS